MPDLWGCLNKILIFFGNFIESIFGRIDGLAVLEFQIGPEQINTKFEKIILLLVVFVDYLYYLGCYVGVTNHMFDLFG